MIRFVSVICVAAMSLLSGAAYAQALSDSLPTDPTVQRSTREDSAATASSPLQARTPDTIAVPYKETKSPLLALALSTVVPGAGQFYNESYWKIPILLGFGYYFAKSWIEFNDSTKHYRSLFARSISPDNPGGNSRYLQLREFYKDQRDTFSWYIFIYYIVNLVDAYVDASLFDFNVGDDLSVRVMPHIPADAPSGMGVRMRITL
ncbi:MAG: hypothetical protein C4326_01960 [Ignavibacteria bacterium]